MSTYFRTLHNQPEVTLILAAKTCITCAEVNVYAIKINNFQQLRNKLNADLSDPNTIGLSLSDKIQFADDQFAKKHSLTMNQVDLEKLFLENFANHQISLFKAKNDLTNWSNLTLSSNPIAPIEENPCN